MNAFSSSHQVIAVMESVHVRGPCNVTGQIYMATYPKDGIDKWLAGAFIQDAMPDVNAGDREFLISGTSPAGWDKLFQMSSESNG